MEVAGGSVLIRVADKGMGISKEDQKMLFSTFFRTSAAIASGAPGTGLGLVIVRSIVEGHGGKIEVESETGQGTTVTVRLPMGDAASSQAEADEEAA
jgi:signal transduction histidine kinase